MLTRLALFGWAAAVAIGAMAPVLATDMPVPLLKIGDVLPANAIPSKALLLACAKEPSAKETPKQFVKRMMLPCPGRLE